MEIGESFEMESSGDFGAKANRTRDINRDKRFRLSLSVDDAIANE